jgi:hypothetical protein
VIALRSGSRAGPVLFNPVPVRGVIDVLAVGAVVVGLVAGVLVVPDFLGSLHRLPIPFAGRHGHGILPRLGARGLWGTVVPVRTIRIHIGACRWCSRRLGKRVVDGMRDRRDRIGQKHVGGFESGSRRIGWHSCRIIWTRTFGVLWWLGDRSQREHRLERVLRSPRGVPVEATDPWTAGRKGRWAFSGLIRLLGMLPWRRWPPKVIRSWSMVGIRVARMHRGWMGSAWAPEHGKRGTSTGGLQKSRSSCEFLLRRRAGSGRGAGPGESGYRFMTCPRTVGVRMCQEGALMMRSGRGIRGVIFGNGFDSFRSCADLPSPGRGFAGDLGTVFSVLFESFLVWC